MDFILGLVLGLVVWLSCSAYVYNDVGFELGKIEKGNSVCEQWGGVHSYDYRNNYKCKNGNTVYFKGE